MKDVELLLRQHGKPMHEDDIKSRLAWGKFTRQAGFSRKKRTRAVIFGPQKPLNKYQRRRRKLVASGRCPHCGKECAPFYECADRRTYKGLCRELQRLVKAGLIKKNGNLYSNV